MRLPYCFEQLHTCFIRDKIASIEPNHAGIGTQVELELLTLAGLLLISIRVYQ